MFFLFSHRGTENTEIYLGETTLWSLSLCARKISRCDRPQRHANVFLFSHRGTENTERNRGGQLCVTLCLCVRKNSDEVGHNVMPRSFFILTQRHRVTQRGFAGGNSVVSVPLCEKISRSDRPQRHANVFFNSHTETQSCTERHLVSTGKGYWVTACWKGTAGRPDRERRLALRGLSFHA